MLLLALLAGCEIKLIELETDYRTLSHMETIHEIRKITDHKIVITLPRSFQGKEVEVIVLPFKPKVAETMLLSEASLAKDWNNTEENKAWENL